MADWPLIADVQAFEAVGTSGSTGTTVTANASANTLGSFTQLIASTAFAAHGIIISLHPTTNADFLVDISVGAASSEQPLVQQLLCSRASAPNAVSYYFPLHIPSGSRLASRCQCSTGGGTVIVSVSLLSHGLMSPSGPTLFHVNLADVNDSGGLSVDPGAVANTKGAYVSQGELADSASWLGIGIGNQANTARTLCTWLIDIAVGAGGSETVIVPNLFVVAGTNGAPHGIPTGFPCSISEPGATVSVRAACSITDATDRLIDVTLYGVR